MHYVVLDNYNYVFGIYENKEDIGDQLLDKCIIIDDELYLYLISNIGRKKYNGILFNQSLSIKHINYFEFIFDDGLAMIKQEKIEESRIKLEEYFKTHTCEFTRNNGNIGIYSITSEKQQYLALEIQVATMATQNNIPYQASWNCTGMPCTYDYTLDELCRLAFEINGIVKPRISLQQTIESQIKNANTIEELNNMVIKYE